MYVEDMTLADAYTTRRELLKEKREFEKMGWPAGEQLLWDIEDVEGRIFVLTA